MSAGRAADDAGRGKPGSTARHLSYRGDCPSRARAPMIANMFLVAGAHAVWLVCAAARKGGHASEPAAAPAPQILTTQALLSQANAAYESLDYDRVVPVAQELLKRSDLSSEGQL